jgi:hypothetical protein
MSGFTSDWLALREPADHRARAPGLAARVGAAFGEHEEIAVIDLGAGTGANLRYLAPRLGRRQHWTLVDDTPALLAAVGAASHDWARALSLTIPSRSAALHWQGDGLDCDAVVCRHDLTELDTLDLPEGALVTASALLDLVSAPWLQRLAARAAGAHATCLFALSYDGRIALTPADPLDAEIASLVNRHQRGLVPERHCSQTRSRQGHHLARTAPQPQPDGLLPRSGPRESRAAPPQTSVGAQAGPTGTASLCVRRVEEAHAAGEHCGPLQAVVQR